MICANQRKQEQYNGDNYGFSHKSRTTTAVSVIRDVNWIIAGLVWDIQYLSVIRTTVYTRIAEEFSY